ncbi:MAG: prepilin-type N-terminal cleavage/methylation domain-containing protein [Xanthomonadales bacterium]|nr:prepilin-type N-terminal cleavage/methylation domain-containing protein [Xanthomonadales bacterium]
MRFGPAGQRGFTLLEILAAFVIFALVFATTLQVLSGSLRNTRQSAEYTEAALRAQSVMDSVGVEPLLEVGTYEGELENGYRWEMEISQYDIQSEPTPDGRTYANLFEVPIDLYEVQLTLTWGDPDRPRGAVFRTLRSVTAEPQ